MRYIWKFHDWYDTLEEPHRFLLMLVIVLPLITPALWIKGWVTLFIYMAYFHLMLMTRVYRHHFRRKPKALRKASVTVPRPASKV